MIQHAVLFVIGTDRPGIVDNVTSFLFRHKANLEDSRMATMAGQFTITSLFSTDEEALEDIRQSLDELAKAGLQASLHNVPSMDRKVGEGYLPLKLVVTAMDHPGIVQTVVSLLHRHGVNIEELDTTISTAPMSAIPLFNLKLKAGVPAKSPIARVKDDLMELAAEENLDLTFGS